MFSNTPPEVHAPVPGTLIGPWRVLKRMGSGNNGIVYRVCLADEPGAGEYALKLAKEPGDPRFEREAELLSRIHHAHVPSLRDRGLWQCGGRSWYPYVVMQWVEGVPLYDWAQRRGITSRQALLLLAQVARALDATHQHGTHRDVKGDNVLVTSDGHAVLVDYGCCWYEGARPLTDTAVPPGTRTYRSPQCLRHQYEHRREPEVHYAYPPEDDVYALGVTAYYLVTGAYPPPGTDPECRDDPERPRPPPLLPPSELATVVPELEVLILQMLQEDRQARGTAGELADALEKAARSAGPAADVRVQPSRSMLPTERARRPGPPLWYLLSKVLRRNTRPLAVAGALAALMMAVLFLPAKPKGEQQPEVLAKAQEESEDAGRKERTVSLADGGVDAVLTTTEKKPQAGVPTEALALPLPKKPFPAQRKPPCAPDQRVINGVCWWLLPRKPPCGDAYDYEEGCYLPVVANARVPTSEER